jgi:hypothetical protein
MSMKDKLRWEEVSLYELFVKKSRGQANDIEKKAVEDAMADRRPGRFRKIYKVRDQLVVR